MKSDRKEKEKQLRKKDILEAAERVFAKKGFHDTTMNDIARESQFAVGTIYLYFKDKQSLYFTLMKNKFETIITAVKTEVMQTDAGSKLKTLIYTQLKNFESNKDFFRIFLSESRTNRDVHKENLTKEHIKGFVKHIEFIAQVIKESIEAGVIKRNIDPLRAAYLIAAMMNASVFYWVQNPKKDISLDNQVEFVYNFTINGIGD
jgi:AcrR family transcriptional regulator